MTRERTVHVEGCIADASARHQLYAVVMRQTDGTYRVQMQHAGPEHHHLAPTVRAYFPRGAEASAIAEARRIGAGIRADAAFMKGLPR